MKKILSTFIAMVAICIVMTSCEKEEKAKSTTVTINVKDGSGVAQSGMDVYMYTKAAFVVQGNDPFFAHKTATTDASGNALFDIKNPDDVLWSPSNTSEELYFGIVYNLSGVKEKHVVVTVSEGDTKTANLTKN
ncbi:MAG: hypothetical protein KDE33_29230 [Bacteroidetes bacterium]|nr:hypothetical protein [Bacteroidota bacterium]